MIYPTNSWTLRRVSASAHNCALIIVGSLPLLPLLGRENWRYAVITICFVFHIVFRRRDLGGIVNGLKYDPPPSVLWCALYSCGFSTIFYSVAVPFDVLGLYVLLQGVCLRATGYTIPGLITQWRPTHEDPRRTFGGVQASCS